MTGIYLLIYPVSMVIQNHPRLKEISIQAWSIFSFPSFDFFFPVVDLIHKNILLT